MLRALFLVLGLILAPVARAEVSAILIGVSDYSDASGIADLKGPANDVLLLRDVLDRQGVTNVKVLADGIPGATRPTLGAILGVLTEKAAEVGQGDFVYIHYSGHGTQQPDDNGDEVDGLDEVLLPADAGPASRGRKAVENGLTDDALGAAIDRITAKGALVWLVLDSCHAGTGLRSAASAVADRYVDPEGLGLPPAPDIAMDETVTDDDLPKNDRVIAFYSAQSSERAREVDLSAEDAPEAWFGLFSARMAAQLDGNPGQSFRQLFQATMREMNDKTTPGAARLQTPMWEGGLIDTGVFGADPKIAARRFELRDDVMLAGRVHGLTQGTVVGLFASPSDPEDAILGYGQITESAAATSVLRAVSEGCRPDPASLCAAC